MTIKLHKAEDFECMRIAGTAASFILDYITDFVTPGATTNFLNEIAHNKIIQMGWIPAPLGYKGYPKSICTSLNHVICHGIPDEKKIKEGDILNIDVTVIVNGWHGDSSRMYLVGDKAGILAKRLVQTTYDAMMLGIEQIKPGNTIGNIGHAIQTHAESKGYSVVRDYCGHGIGRIFHDEPNILHYGKKNDGIELVEGMFFTVEPMINAGKPDTILSKKDGWTVYTRDKSLSAQFEHTVGVTSSGFEIFTLSNKNWHFPPYEK